MSEEVGSKNTTKKQIWESTGSTFLFKFIFALSFIIPVLLLNLRTAIIASLIWGFSLMTLFSFYMAKKQDKDPKKVVLGHLVIAAIVVIITNFIGKLISSFFV